MDGMTLYAIRSELSLYLPLKVQRIYHSSPKELLLSVWGKNNKGDLLISHEANSPFLGFINYRPEMPQKASGICLGLRNRLEGGVLEEIRQEGMDRILYLDFTGRNRLGSRVKYTLVFDAAGHGGGIALVEKDEIILTVSGNHSRFDQGETYAAPRSNKLNLLEQADLGRLSKQICGSVDPAHRALVNNIDGMGKDLALGVANKIGLGPDQSFDETSESCLTQMLTELQSRLLLSQFSPGLYMRRSGQPKFGIFPLAHLTEIQNCSSVLECAALYKAYDTHFKAYETLKRKTHSTLRQIKNKIVTRYNAQKNDFDKALDFDKFRIWAQLIDSSGKQLPAGFEQIEVLDYYKEPPEKALVPLDPRLTASENARRYYKIYTKSKRTKSILEQSVQRAGNVLDKISQAETALNCETDIDDLARILDGLRYIAREFGLRPRIRHDKAGEKSKTAPKSTEQGLKESVDTVSGPGGAIAYVGANARGNDQLLRHVKRHGDLWFHAKGVKGAHVLLRNPSGKANTEEQINWAAGLAVKRSGAALAGKAEVDYVEAMAVKKPKGAPLGFVTYKGARTLVIKTL